VTDSDSGPSSTDDGSDVSVVRFDATDRPPSVVVAETLETVLDDRNRTLFDYVDPDAMDELLGGRGSAASITVSFEVGGTSVTVHGDGRVVVRWA